MSVPPIPRRPAPRLRPARPKAATATPRRPRWGWLEWFAVSLTLFPALLFLPGATVVRPFLRIAAYLMGPFAWMMVARQNRPEVPGHAFAARPWLIFCGFWLVLSIAHPNSYSIVAATAEAALYLAVMSPAFWGTQALKAPNQISRLMAVLFLCNALSAAVGVAQVYRPEQFNPPVIPALNNKYGGDNLKYETSDGRRILRPCGLTDTPGAAAHAGNAAAIIGLCFALRPIAAWKRLACVGLSLIGVAAIYYSHVRSVLIMVVISIIVLAVVLSLQRNYRQASLLVSTGATVLVAAMAWAVQTVGVGTLNRFTELFEGDVGSYFFKLRGAYIEQALTEVVWDNPLGYGMGWWGQIHGLFADPNRISYVWVEVMIPAWIYDGGFPLLIGYVGAIVLALYDTGRIALHNKDRELAFWAAVVLALNLSTVATCFSYISFLTPVGMTFWLLAAVVNSADRQALAAERKPDTGPTRPRPRRWGIIPRGFASR